jgi:transcriptional regulator with XRE-family HTH domain
LNWAIATLLWDIHAMLIWARISAIREARKLSQDDVETRCGLLPVKISRVEIVHLVPSVETLEKLARALEVPLYQLFYEAKERPLRPHLPSRKLAAEITWGTTRKEIYFWEKLRGLLARMSESDRRLLLTWPARWLSGSRFKPARSNCSQHKHLLLPARVLGYNGKQTHVGRQAG